VQRSPQSISMRWKRSMSAKAKRPSPILGAASTLIDEASDVLVTKASRFRHTFEAAVEAIQPDPNQPRKVFGDEDISLLAETMNERGQLQPILLRRDSDAKGRWFIVAGERRWRAAKLNKWPTILAIEHDGDPEIASLLENLQRVDLSPIEEARGVQRLIQGKGWSQEHAADALGKSKSEVSGTLRILTLPGDFLAAVLTSELAIPKNVLVELARVEDSSARDHLLGLAREGRLTVRAIRAMKDGDNPGHNDKATDVGERQRPVSRQFSFGSLEKVAISLRAIRETGRPILATDRARLEHLRREIDQLLGVRGTDSADL